VNPFAVVRYGGRCGLVGALLRHRTGAIACAAVVGVALSACGPNGSSAGSGAAAAAQSTLDNGDLASPSPQPAITPLPYPAPTFSNPAIGPGLASTGYATYQPPSSSAAVVTRDQAVQTATTAHDPRVSAPEAATLVLLQYKDGSRPPFLAWVVDCTPTGPVQMFGAPQGVQVPATVTYKFWVVIISADSTAPDAGKVVFQQGG
jgi:hypothetical protein